MNFQIIDPADVYSTGPKHSHPKRWRGRCNSRLKQRSWGQGHICLPVEICHTCREIDEGKVERSASSDWNPSQQMQHHQVEDGSRPWEDLGQNWKRSWGRESAAEDWRARMRCHCTSQEENDFTCVGVKVEASYKHHFQRYSWVQVLFLQKIHCDICYLYVSWFSDTLPTLPK